MIAIVVAAAAAGAPVIVPALTAPSDLSNTTASCVVKNCSRAVANTVAATAHHASKHSKKHAKKIKHRANQALSSRLDIYGQVGCQTPTANTYTQAASVYLRTASELHRAQISDGNYQVNFSKLTAGSKGESVTADVRCAGSQHHWSTRFTVKRCPSARQQVGLFEHGTAFAADPSPLVSSSAPAWQSVPDPTVTVTAPALDPPVTVYQQPAANPTVTVTAPAPAPGPTLTVTPSPPVTTTAGCYPLSDEGTCYEPGQYCRDTDHGMSGVAGDGEQITCEDNNGWRWEPASLAGTSQPNPIMMQPTVTATGTPWRMP